MKKLVIIALIMMSLFAISHAYAQQKEEKAAQKTEGNVSAPVVADTSSAIPVKEEKPSANEVSIYGEVRDISVTAGTVTVQYYDYDTDNEKSIAITVAPKTKFENAPNIGGIKKGDWVDVTYVVSGSDNIANSIVVEQEDEGEKPVVSETATDQETKSGDIPEEKY